MRAALKNSLRRGFMPTEDNVEADHGASLFGLPPIRNPFRLARPAPRSPRIAEQGRVHDPQVRLKATPQGKKRRLG